MRSIVKFTLIIFIGVILLTLACQTSQNDPKTKVLREVLRTEKLTYHVEADSLVIDVTMPKEITVDREFLGSLAFFIVEDTKTLPQTPYLKVKFDEAQVLYNRKEYPIYNEMLERCYEFMHHFLMANSSLNLPYVDSTKISLMDLKKLDDIANILNPKDSINKNNNLGYKFVGFRRSFADLSVVEYQVDINSKEEVIPCYIQLSMNNRLIRSIKINDD
ncbi:MAG: hypothetical protein MUE53_05285 [Chitinophagales bacterium]|jgi:hypothetical protein|nr:hypothetical protein [Chitinophagales bacterium]